MVLAVTVTAVIVVAIAVASVFLLTGRDHPSTPAGAASATGQPPPQPPEPLPPSGSAVPTAPATSAAPLTPPAGCANCTMSDGVTYTVGGTGTHTARAGQYHTTGPTGADGCTIKIVRMGQRSTEKTYRLAADVLVKDTEQFTSHGCKPWVWQATP
jgi:hypothetical protein